jgi:hypothetical protein
MIDCFICQNSLIAFAQLDWNFYCSMFCGNKIEFRRKLKPFYSCLLRSKQLTWDMLKMRYTLHRIKSDFINFESKELMT